MSREERTVRGKVTAVADNVYTPHNNGKVYIVQVNGSDETIGFNDHWFVDPTTYAVGDELDLTFRSGQLWQVRRVPVAAPLPDGKQVVEATA